MGSECKTVSILVTGGAGFIGTHTVLQLLNGGFHVTVIDNLDNSVEDAVDRVRDLAGPDLSLNLKFQIGDLRNKNDLEKLFSETRFEAVVHFAGLKAVGESVANPFRYFDNNLIGTLNLYEIMTKYGCKKMVFSSSATVYGQPEKIPCVEDFELVAMNPYGRTKLFLEEIARDIQKADSEWRIILLRYFNPVGAHESGHIGEDPIGIPNNLMPYIQQVAVGRLPELNVYGYDYPTKDGSADGGIPLVMYARTCHQIFIFYNNLSYLQSVQASADGISDARSVEFSSRGASEETDECCDMK